MTSGNLVLRPPLEGDYDHFIVRLDEWWGGRSMSAMLPKLFFVHFPDTSVVAVDERTGERLGFLCGFLSQADEETAYIHFVGVDPGSRRRGLGRGLYGWFFDLSRREGRPVVTCVTSPLNERSIAFHEAMGFESEEVDDYDGPGEDRVVFRRRLS